MLKKLLLIFGVSIAPTYTPLSIKPDNPNIVEVLVEAGVSCDSQMMQKLSRKRKRKEIQLDGELTFKALLLARDEY
ncbi:hypothetical protein [Mastigocladopsis repens]|uniref:hypothetical protein n=1 Tax=Mastigocladopsis repens TaxID=221287 RepID=UPI00036F192A|nr:hypothetical protein [Mastigocladopsis repens]